MIARNEALKKKAEEREAANAEQAAKAPEQKTAPVERRQTVTVNSTSESSTSESKPTERRTEDTDSSDEGEKENKSVEKKDKITAREALEIILLAGKTLPSLANASGYVSPRSPGGCEWVA